MSVPLSAMVSMSRAIRGELESRGYAGLADVPTEVLSEYATIVGAFALDLQAELERRRGCSD